MPKTFCFAYYYKGSHLLGNKKDDLLYPDRIKESIYNLREWLKLKTGGSVQRYDDKVRRSTKLLPELTLALKFSIKNNYFMNTTKRLTIK